MKHLYTERTMEEIRFGLLPMYLELYDRVSPQGRSEVEAFCEQIKSEFLRRGLHPETTAPCRIDSEFRQAVNAFENAGVCAIVTLHLAYSPSLEAIGALAGTALPIIVLDTTPDRDFGPSQDPARIRNNHGIHGVQDMCNLLMRHGKNFAIEAGHRETSDVIDRVCEHIKASAMAAAMKATRTGILGEKFEGMGDFSVPDDVLTELTGGPPVKLDAGEIASLTEAVSESDIETEMRDDLKRFIADGLDPETHRKSTIAALALRRWIEKENIDAFSVNFLHITRESGMPVMPFLEISKAMARRIGYAGEGDLLTASLVSALARLCGETTFTEMFCPDWAGNRIFLSHMGEVNIDLLAGKPELVCKPFPYTDADSPVVAAGCLKPGDAVLVNLAPVSDSSFRLILAPGRMHEAQNDRFKNSVRGWFEPRMPIADFLESYSRLGGTHHSALVYGTVTDLLRKFATFMGWETHVVTGARSL